MDIVVFTFLFTFMKHAPGAVPPGHICGPPIGKRCCAAGRGYEPPLTNRGRSGRTGGWWCRTGGARPQSCGSKPLWWTCSEKEGKLKVRARCKKIKIKIICQVQCTYRVNLMQKCINDRKKGKLTIWALTLSSSLQFTIIMYIIWVENAFYSWLV